MKILITGGAGFIGSNIADRLINLGYQVRVIDNLITGRISNIEHLLNNPNFEFINGDITNLDTCKDAMIDIDAINHQAALGSVPRSINDPLPTHNNNVNGFFNILLCAYQNNIKRIVYASSSSVYGSDKNLPKIEDTIGEVLSPYACTKKINELYASIFTRCYSMEIIGLRYFNIFGPRQDPNGPYAAVIPKFIDQIINNRSPTINGDGSYSRDFTYIDNAVQANIKALTTRNSQCFGQVLNIANGKRTSIIELFNIIKNYFNCKIVPIFKNKRPGDIPHSNANITKAYRYINYKPSVTLEEGIRKTIEYYLNIKNQR